MTINITSGQLLNEILQNKYPHEVFIPFNEAMITGTYTTKLFSDEFIVERAKVHNVSEAFYRENLKSFLDFLVHLTEYSKVVLWFGDEPFCIENRHVVIQTLSDYNFSGQLLLHIVNENTGEILRSETIM